MKEVKELGWSGAEKRAAQILRIANEAVAEAKAENRRCGLASPVWLNGQLQYELPDGTITDRKPVPWPPPRPAHFTF